VSRKTNRGKKKSQLLGKVMEKKEDLGFAGNGIEARGQPSIGSGKERPVKRLTNRRPLTGISNGASSIGGGPKPSLEAKMNGENGDYSARMS